MAKLLLFCFKPMRDDSSHSGTSLGPRVDSGSTGSPDGHKQTVGYVELLKHTNEPLGLVLHGGKDMGVPVHVGTLHPGGVAANSRALQPGDLILGVNGVPTQHFTHAEVNTLLDNAGNVINLEIAFEAPSFPVNDEATLKKTAIINLPLESNDSNSYGFTISGGKTENRPITVSNITLDTTAFRNGFVKAGDNILKVNGVDVTNASQKEAIDLLKSSGDMCTLEIQYDVQVFNVLNDDAPRGPMQVVLFKPRGVSLGISLRRSPGVGEPLRISRIKEAGIADRCGALHVGDCIKSVNGQSLEGKSVQEAYKSLKFCDLQVQLDILPPRSQAEETFEDTESTVSGLPSCLSRRPSQMSVDSAATSAQLTSHPESMVVSLAADEVGFGLSLQGGATDYANYPITICSIEDGGPAARLGQLQVGDRVLAINEVKLDGCTLQQAVKLVAEAGNVIELEVTFDVQDFIVPTSGTFEVTLVKTASLNLGITINGSSHNQVGDPIWISRLKEGGIAYRTGMLHSGDILLAIDGVSLENATLSDAVQMLRNGGDSVTLKVTKEAAVPKGVVVTVELQRNQQSLGITLTGNRDQPGHPIIISKIKEDGIAHKTGVLNIGDSLLAINGQSLVNATVPDAVYMLRNAGDIVNLKIRRAISRSRRGRSNPSSKMYRSGFHHSGSGRGASRQSRLEAQESYRRLLALRQRRLSQTTIATSISGRSTPDNRSTMSIDQSSYAGSFYGPQMDPSGRDSALSQLTPSEFGGSAFSRPTSVLSNSGRYGYNGYSESNGAGYGYSHAQPPSMDIRPGYRLPSAVRSETDEELSPYWDDSQWSRRPAFPSQRPGSKKWDFKSNRNQRRHSYKSKLVGRVSPLPLSLDPPNLTSSPPSIQRLDPNIPPSPVKEQPDFSVNNGSENPTSEDPKVTSQESMEQEADRIENGVIDVPRSESKLSSTGSTSAERERVEYGGSSSVSGGGSPEPPLTHPTPTLSCTVPVPQATGADSAKPSREEWPQTEELPGYEESAAGSGQRGSHSPTITTSTVDVLKTPVSESPTGSMNRKTRSPKLALLEMNESRMSTEATVSPTQSSLHVATEPPRRTSAPESVAMKSKHQGHDLRSKSTSSFEPSPNMQDYKRTIQRANEFEKAMKALAESGSSDQDSDSETHSKQPEETATIQEKMQATIPLNHQLKAHHIEIRKKPGISFGFGLADGYYDPGVFVKAVKEGSPADKAGLQPFDTIMKIGETQLTTDDTCETIDPLLKRCGDYIELVVARQHQQVTGESHC